MEPWPSVWTYLRLKGTAPKTPWSRSYPQFILARRCVMQTWCRQQIVNISLQMQRSLIRPFNVTHHFYSTHSSQPNWSIHWGMQWCVSQRSWWPPRLLTKTGHINWHTNSSSLVDYSQCTEPSTQIDLVAFGQCEKLIICSLKAIILPRLRQTMKHCSPSTMTTSCDEMRVVFGEVWKVPAA